MNSLSLKERILEYKWLIIFFSVFVVAQTFEASILNWDSLVYLFQGKWFCGEQIYFE